MNPHRMAVELAKRTLGWSAPEKVAAMDKAELVSMATRLRGALVDLIAVAEAQPKSARMRVQHDAEFVNLARAARMDIHAMKGSFGRVDRLLDALTAMVEPAADADGGQS
ncbi:hypothetical protein [Streptomyces sp. WAC05858]|uniref:hypothetical protein n=1 Tax=Streptomyces TaxID=1883 RepID=UPI000F77ABB2|nr:hypothetical protein [Streptomyces sp. WAC05858]RSS47565.1 hypothetical protein EF902_08920 [Streptomyces sp. WAC05858]